MCNKQMHANKDSFSHLCLYEDTCTETCWTLYDILHVVALFYLFYFLGGGARLFISVIFPFSFTLDEKIDTIHLWCKPPGSVQVEPKLTSWPNRGIIISVSVTWCYWAKKRLFLVHVHGERDVCDPTSKTLKTTSVTIRISFIHSDNVWKV